MFTRPASQLDPATAPCMSKFEYADDAALVDDEAATATTRVTTIAAGSVSVSVA